MTARQKDRSRTEAKLYDISSLVVLSLKATANRVA